jgi:hypothetical protein
MILPNVPVPACRQVSGSSTATALKKFDERTLLIPIRPAFPPMMRQT